MRKKIVDGLIIGAGIAAIASLLFIAGIFAPWQDRLSDLLFRKQKPSSQIVIIAIDDKSIRAIGRWPWDRSTYAKLLTILDSKPATTGFDITFSEPSTASEDATLAAALNQSGPHVVLASEAKHGLGPLEQFMKSATTGAVDVIVDDDKVVRRIPLQFNFQNTQLPHFTVQLLNNVKQPLLPQFQMLQNTNQPMRIVYAGPPQTFPAYSFVDVFTGVVPPETFTNKIVLVGATAQDLHDDQLTPVSNLPMSGVEIQANALSTLQSHQFLQNESRRWTIGTFFVIALVLSFIFIFFEIGPAITFIFIGTACYYIYAFISFDQGLIRNLIYPPIIILAAFIFHLIYKYKGENHQKRYIRRALAYYLSPSVMSEVLQDPSKLRLGGSRQEMTVLFSDIAGFTSISEKLAAEELAHMLNKYLTEMTNIVYQYDGVLDKYIGDAMMAFWGAPVMEKKHALLACQTALAMQTEVKKIRSQWQAQGIPHFDVRIGINTGEMVVGNMGSQSRFDYTVIGDNVNLGSRLEGMNKEYGTKIIISESTYKAAKNGLVVRRLDTVAVKGKTQGIVIYELRGIGHAERSEKEFLKKFETARQLYEEGKFKDALVAFEKLAVEFPNDVAVQKYVGRCQNLDEEPPENWDGVFRAKTK